MIVEFWHEDYLDDKDILYRAENMKYVPVEGDFINFDGTRNYRVTFRGFSFRTGKINIYLVDGAKP